MRHRTTTKGLALLWVLALPLLWLSLTRAPALRVDVGIWGDHAVLQGANGPEQSSTEDYRWTTAASSLAFPNLSPSYRVLVLRAHGWRPDGASPQVALDVAGRHWGSIQTSAPLRVYHVLLPEQPSAWESRIGLVSESYQPPGDQRTIGFAVDWVELRRAGGPAAPALWQLLGQALLLGLGCLIAGFFGRPGVVAAALALAGLVALNLAEPLWVGLALAPWLVTLSGVGLLLWLGGPRALILLRPWMGERQAQMALALLIVGLVLRLLGATHPFFDAHDLPVHDRWMRAVAGGQLYLYSTPGELQNRLTFNPPAGYLLLLPLWLALGELRLVIQAGTALVDWAGLALLLPLMRALRLSSRAALIGLALYTALPINMTILWWGFAANDIAQTLWIALAWLLLQLARRPTPRLACGVGVATAACAMTHVGALVLVAPLLAGLALAAIVLLPRRTWLLLVGSFVGLALLALPIYFSAAAAPVLQQPPNPSARTLGESFARSMTMVDVRLLLVGRAFQIGYGIPLLALLPAGLLLLWRTASRQPLSRALVGMWVAASVGFFGIYMTLGFLTRYIYFLAPLVCLAGGAAGAALSRSRSGRLLIVALVVLVAWLGAELWLGGVLLRDKPSLVPLTQ